MEIRRSILSVPGHIDKMHIKASTCQADVIMFDLEDSVPLDLKKKARETVVQSIRSLDWSNKLVSIRVNAIDTPYAYEDVIFCVEHCGSVIRSIVLPKVNHEGDIHFLDRLLLGIERNLHFQKTVSIEASIETASGLERIREISSSVSRLKSLVFGIADYTASIGAPLTSLSGHGDDRDRLSPGQRWHYVLSRIVMTAKSNNLYAIDAPYGNFTDEKGLRESASTSRLLGFDGKWVIHPDQIATVNDVYSPSDAEIERAKQIIEIHHKALSKGRGAASEKGSMVDSATLRLAEKIWSLAVQLGKVE